MKWLTAFLVLVPALCFGQAVPVLSHSHVNGTVIPSTTVYSVMGQTVITEFPTEAWAQVPWYQAGTFSQMYVRLEDNSITNASTFTIRINGASGNESVVMSGNTVKIGTDSVHTDHINSGDKMDIQMKTGSGGTTLEPIAIEFLFTPDDASTNYQRWSPAASNGGNLNTNGYQPYYSNVVGLMGLNFYDSNTYHVMRTSGTFKNIGVYVSSNARVETNTISLWKNGSPSTLSVDIPANTNGLLQNTTTQVSYVIGDTVTFSIGMAGGLAGDGNLINFMFLTMDVVSTGPIEYAAGIDGKDQNAGESWTLPPMGALTYGGDEYPVPALVAGTLNNFCVYESNNNMSVASTVKFRKNLVTDPNIVMTIPINSSSGTFCDNSHSVTVTSTDTIGYITNSPSGTGTFFYGSVMAAFTPTSQLTSAVFPPIQMNGPVTFKGNGVLK